MQSTRNVLVRVVSLALIASALMAYTGTAAAQAAAHQTPTKTYTFQTVTFPGDTFTRLLGINDQQVIAGYHGDGTTTPSQGFTLTLPGNFTDENFPNAAQTQVRAIDSHGDTAGFYQDQIGMTHGFVKSGGTFVTIDLPGTTFDEILGLNKHGQSTGFFQDAAGLDDSYIRDAQSFFLVTPINNSQATDINDQGLVVGFTQPPSTGTSSGFILHGTTVTLLNYPGAVFTEALGVNNNGQVVGFYHDGVGNSHGFIYRNGTYRTVDVPGAVSTTISGINDSGAIVGSFLDQAGNTDGFVGTLQ